MSKRRREFDNLTQTMQKLDLHAQTITVPLPQTQRAMVPTWGQLKKMNQKAEQVLQEAGQPANATTLFLAMLAVISTQSGEELTDRKT